MLNNKKKFIPKKKLSQNFLNNLYIINIIISIIKFKKKEILIEFGSGFGVFSKLIILNIYKIILTEIDSKLIIFLKQYLQFKKKKIILYKKNFLKINLFRINKKKKKLINIIGNIPYNITTNFIFYIIKYLYYIKYIYIILQKEFSNKIINIKNNRISIIIKYFYNIIPIFKISKKSFIPMPKIKSNFIILKPCNKKYFVNNINILIMIIKNSFQQKRKKIKTNLRKIFTIKQIKLIKINHNFRPQDIKLFEFCLLTNLIIINFFYKNKYFKI